MEYIEISARDPNQVNLCFERIARKFRKKEVAHEDVYAIASKNTDFQFFLRDSQVEEMSSGEDYNDGEEF